MNVCSTRLFLVAISLVSAGCADIQRTPTKSDAWGDYRETHFQFEQDQRIQRLLLELAALEPQLQGENDVDFKSGRRLIEALDEGSEIFHIQRVCTHMLWLLGNRKEGPARFEVFLLDYVGRARNFEIPMTDIQIDQFGHECTTCLMVEGFVVDVDRHRQLLDVLVEKALEVLDAWKDPDWIGLYCGVLEEILKDLKWETSETCPRAESPDSDHYVESLRETLRWCQRQLRP